MKKAGSCYGFLFSTVWVILLLLCGCSLVLRPTVENHITVEQYDETRLNYKVTKVDFYAQLQLETNEGDDVFLHDVAHDAFAFSLRYDDSSTGNAPDKVRGVGVYNMGTGDVRFFNNIPMYLYDVILDGSEQVFYSGYSIGTNNWYIASTKNRGEKILDSGESRNYLPVFARFGDRIAYLYEKQTTKEGLVEYEYGVNAVADGKIFPLVTVKKEFREGYKSSEYLIGAQLMTNGNQYALLIERDGRAVVDIYTEKMRVASVVLQDRIYNMTLLRDSIFFSVQDRDSSNPKLAVQAFDGSKSIMKTNEFSPSYRMVSNRDGYLLAIDMSFNICILGVADRTLLRKAVNIAGQEGQAVEFHFVDEKRWLVHYPFRDGKRAKMVYLLEITD